jgi:subtilisin family serine protease
MRCSSLLTLCLLALLTLAASSASELGNEDQTVGASGASIAGIGEAPTEPERTPDPASIERMMDTTGVSALHKKNITGKGVTVAILDSQFYYDEETGKRLPLDLVSVYNNSYRKDEVHGAACAELISRIAPGVKLYLVDVGEDEIDIKTAIDWLMEQEEHIDIVSCSFDIPFGSFDGEDSLCEEVERMTSNGTLWINAAGNQALCHWSGEFRDPDGNGFLNFSPDDESINLTLERGDAVGLWLSWEDEKVGAARDYDLWVDYPSGRHTASGGLQRGYRTHKPVEIIYLFAPEDGAYQIKIRRYDAPDVPVLFHLFTTEELDEHQVPDSSIGILGCCRGVLTVGAINITTLEIQPYSSRGPTKDGRLKPDLVAPDNVTTFSYISDPFSGTSASAPFVAGCAALIMEIHPDRDVRELLIKSATDLGPPGPDDVYGRGLVNVSNLEVSLR